MALINRMTRLVRADMNAVLDQIEEPTLLLRQAIRDMEAEVESTRRHQQALVSRVEALGRRAAELQRSLEESSEQFGLCLDSGEDELARKVLRRKLETERLLKVVASRQDDTRQEVQKHSAVLDEREHVLEGLRQKADVMTEAENGSTDDSGVVGDIAAVTDDDVEVAFLRATRDRQPS